MNTIESLPRIPADAAWADRSEASASKGSHQAGRPRPLGRRTWLVLASLAVCLVLASAMAHFVMNLGWGDSVRVFIDGEQVFGSPDLGELTLGKGFQLVLAYAFIITLTMLVMFIVVPLVVAIAVVAAGIAVLLAAVLGLGLPLLIVLLVGAVALAPAILIGWLLYKLFS